MGTQLVARRVWRLPVPRPPPSESCARAMLLQQSRRPARGGDGVNGWGGMPDETGYDEIKFGIGQPVTRVEDPRLPTGGGRFTGDTSVPGQAYAYFVRSQVAHGEIRGLRAGSYMGYPMPRADHITAIDFATHGVPRMTNLPGVTGRGETGNGGGLSDPAASSAARRGTRGRRD